MAVHLCPYQILLAEDSAADLGLVRMALMDQDLAHVLHVARDGEAAIAFIANADADTAAPRPDLVILDMHLPKYDGNAILQQLRARERHARTPVVFMTSMDDPTTRDAGGGHSPLVFFPKPSSLSAFKQIGVIVRDILMRNAGPLGQEE